MTNQPASSPWGYRWVAAVYASIVLGLDTSVILWEWTVTQVGVSLAPLDMLILGLPTSLLAVLLAWLAGSGSDWLSVEVLGFLALVQCVVLYEWCRRADIRRHEQGPLDPPST